MKKMIKNLCKLTLGGILGTIIIVAFLQLVGLMVNIIENNFWLIIPLIVIIAIMLKKEFEK